MSEFDSKIGRPYLDKTKISTSSLYVQPDTFVFEVVRPKPCMDPRRRPSYYRFQASMLSTQIVQKEVSTCYRGACHRQIFPHCSPTGIFHDKSIILGLRRLRVGTPGYPNIPPPIDETFLHDNVVLHDHHLHPPSPPQRQQATHRRFCEIRSKSVMYVQDCCPRTPPTRESRRGLLSTPVRCQATVWDSST